MPTMSDNQVRHAILEALLKEAKDHPTTAVLKREELNKILQVPRNQLEFNMKYLEDKGLVERTGFMGPPYWVVVITAFGIDVVENKEKYANQFPFMQVTIQQIGGDVHGNVVQAVSSQVNFNQQVTNAFKNAYAQVESKSDVPSKQKEAIKKNLEILETELKKKEADAGKHACMQRSSIFSAHPTIQ